jgi:hypothetical protein
MVCLWSSYHKQHVWLSLVPLARYMIFNCSASMVCGASLRSLAWCVTLHFIRTVCDSSCGYVSLVCDPSLRAHSVWLHMVSLALCVTLHNTSLAWYAILQSVCNVCDHSYRFISLTCHYTPPNSSAGFIRMASYSSPRFVRTVCVKPLCSVYNLVWHAIHRRFLSRFFVTRIPTQK